MRQTITLAFLLAIAAARFDFSEPADETPEVEEEVEELIEEEQSENADDSEGKQTNSFGSYNDDAGRHFARSFFNDAIDEAVNGIIEQVYYWTPTTLWDDESCMNVAIATPAGELYATSDSTK